MIDLAYGYEVQSNCGAHAPSRQRAAVRLLRPGALDLEDIHLDHFLPWTFVCHNAPVEVPVVPDVNLSKGNRLPDPAYLPAVVDLHHRALVASRPALEARSWDRVASAYVGDLPRMPEADILDGDATYRAYDQAVRPQLDIARSIGFVGDWR